MRVSLIAAMRPTQQFNTLREVDGRQVRYRPMKAMPQFAFETDRIERQEHRTSRRFLHHRHVRFEMLRVGAGRDESDNFNTVAPHQFFYNASQRRSRNDNRTIA